MLCKRCGEEFDLVHTLHEPLPQGHHLVQEQAPGCPGALVQVIHPPVIHGVGGTSARRQWASDRERDIAAYRRLRKDGVQPKGINGCAEIEQRAGEQHEVERDVVFADRKMAKRVTQGHADAKALADA